MVLATFVDVDASAQALLRPLLIVIGATTAALLLASLALQSTHRGAILTASFLILLRAEDALHAIAGVVLVVLLTAAFGWWARIRRQSITARSVTQLANHVTAILILAVSITAVVSGRVQELALDMIRPAPAHGKVTNARSILVVLLDGYPRADTVERLLDKSNAPFLTALATKGFDVAHQSTSNYMYTALTLSTMLHMEHIDSIKGTHASMRRVINDNPVFTEIREHGYKILANAVPWDGLALRSADAFCGDGGINDFEHHLMRSSLVMPLVEIFNPSLMADRHREYIDVAYKCAMAAARGADTEQRFVFAHVPAPHLPVVYQRDGDPASLSYYSDTRHELTISDIEFAEAYMSHVEYVNRKTLELVDTMISADPEAVIVVMSDHGSEIGLNWLIGADSDLADRFSTLFAARTPGHDGIFGNSPTPVNLFPILFRSYLEESTPYRAETLFVSDAGTPLEVVKVRPGAVDTPATRNLGDDT